MVARFRQVVDVPPLFADMLGIAQQISPHPSSNRRPLEPKALCGTLLLHPRTLGNPLFSERPLQCESFSNKDPKTVAA